VIPPTKMITISSFIFTFILGYRVLGGEVVASNAPEFIATTVSRTETFEMTMMGAGKSVPEHMLTYDISSMFEMRGCGLCMKKYRHMQL
jgi:hypothetical protein